MCENRVKYCPLGDKKTFTKKSRGHFKSSFKESHETCITKWNDSKAATVGSKFMGVDSICTVSQFRGNESRYIRQVS